MSVRLATAMYNPVRPDVIITPRVKIDSPRGRGRALHQAGGLLVEAEGDPEGGVDEKVDPQDLRRGEGLAGREVDQGRAEEGEYERDQLEQDEADVLVEVVVELAALFHRVDDGGEVVVGEDHAAGVFGDFGPAPHGDADVGCFDGGGVVDPIAGHGDDVTLFLERVGQQNLVLGRDPADDTDAVVSARAAPPRTGPRTRRPGSPRPVSRAAWRSRPR